MKRTTTFKLFLASIHYSGGNIGDDIHVAIRALGQVYTLELKLKNGQQQIFEPIKFIAADNFDSRKNELRRKVSITVREQDPLGDDKGAINEFQIIPIVSDSQFNFSLSVEVEEEGKLHSKKRTGHFSFSLVAIFPPFVREQKEDLWFPKLSPPILKQAKSAYLSWSCDPVCLRKCALNDWVCILNCCTKE